MGPRIQGNSCHAIGDREYIIDIELHHHQEYYWSCIRYTWALAAKASAYLHNRVPNKSLEGKVTPYGLWHNNIPHMGHIRI